MTMENWRQSLIRSDARLLEVVSILNNSSAHIVLVVDENERLLGTVTDGDVRRSLLSSESMDATAGQIMNSRPETGRVNEPQEALIARMRTKSLYHIPIIAADGRVVSLFTLSELFQVSRRDNLVVLMAGGYGRRLRPLTIDCPKPMLKVGEKPILELIMGQFIQEGFWRFRISLNYLGDLIESHFGNGSKWNAEISYLREDKPLGTAGALSLLEEKPRQPFIVMNGDLLTKVNFTQLLRYHEEQGAPMTVGVREYEHSIPYGVVDCDNARLVAFREKPTCRHFINAGIYVLSPETLNLFPADAFTDMTEVMTRLIEQGRNPATFPIHEHWLDIGQHDDLARARAEYENIYL